MSASNEHHKEAGVALVTVLMIVASMSIVAVMISSAVLASTNRAKTLDASNGLRHLLASPPCLVIEQPLPFGRRNAIDKIIGIEARMGG